MSAPGHCRHCADGCQYYSHVDCSPYRQQHHGVYAKWHNRHCPACDEAERIAAECIEWAEGCYQRGEDDAVRELNEMADFARGDR